MNTAKDWVDFNKKSIHSFLKLLVKAKEMKAICPCFIKQIIFPLNVSNIQITTINTHGSSNKIYIFKDVN